MNLNNIWQGYYFYIAMSMDAYSNKVKLLLVSLLHAALVGNL